VEKKGVNALAEYPEIDTPNDHHRHTSHLYAIYPGTQISITKTPELARAGFTVLEAPGAEEALHVASEHTGSIDLLVSDVLMPGRNGYDLADALMAVRPDTKVLFMSGYRDKVLNESTGRASSEAPLLRKPFTQYALVSKVQELLDAQSPDTGVAGL